MNKLLRRAWVEINLDALDNNIRLIRTIADGKPLMAIVKANAYGHGIDTVAKELFSEGVTDFAVSNVLEALELRRLLPEAHIVIFGYCDDEWQDEIIEAGFEQTVAGTDFARKLSETALSKNTVLPVHIKVNTGMNRVGIDTREELLEIMSLKGLSIKGVYTHFAVSDSDEPSDIEYTRLQHARLLDIAQPLIENGVPCYSQNSGGILYHSDFGGDYLRSGIIMYGLKPNTALDVPIDLKPILKFKAAVCQIKTVKKGETISYGRTFTADKDMTVAVIPAGYADGYSRANSNNGAVYINGERAPVIGRICMDQFMVDVTGLSVKVGDEAELYSDTIDEIKVDNIADKLGTIGYEITCQLGHRVPRVTVKNNKITEVRSYI